MRKKAIETNKITETMNRVCDELDEPKDQFVAAAARRILENSEWSPDPDPPIGIRASTEPRQ